MNELIELFREEKFSIEQFMKRLVNFFTDNPRFQEGSLPIIHSVKYRLKNEEHLLDKIKRKTDSEKSISKKEFFDTITDLAGIRVLHLYPEQLLTIHNELINEVNKGDLVLFEKPKAYTWDIDLQTFYENLGIETIVKPSYYTSVHYVFMPKAESKIKCEIQVRTLYEEVWGEIEHSLNYPYNCDSLACAEQIKVLAQLTAAGTRLANSIIKSKKEFDEIRNRNGGEVD